MMQNTATTDETGIAVLKSGTASSTQAAALLSCMC